MQLLPIRRRVNSVSRYKLEFICQAAKLAKTAPFVRRSTCDEAGISLFNNVSERGDMINCAACAGSLLHCTCDRRMPALAAPLYEFKQRNFMMVCNKKIDFP